MPISGKGQSEAVHRRGIDNTMAKIKITNGQTMIYKTPHRNQKNSVLFLFHYWHPSCYSN